MEDNKNILSTRIKELRTELGLTQEELALKLGLKGKSSIANYESGKITPSDEIKLKMCNIFDCSMDYLMGKTIFKSIDDLYQNMDNTFIGIYYKRYFNKLLDIGISNSDVKTILDIYFTTPKYSDLLNNKDNISQKQTESLDLVLKKYSPLIYKETLAIINEFLTHKKTILLEAIKPETAKNVDAIPHQYHMCPVYGRISAGIPNWAEECIEGRLPIDPELMNILNPEECFFLRVNGESMNQLVKNGSFALIRKTDMVENGEVAVVLVNRNRRNFKEIQ